VVVGEFLRLLVDRIGRLGAAVADVHATEAGKREFADRVCFFSQGKIIEQGPPRQFLAAPQHERTQQFLRAVHEAV